MKPENITASMLGNTNAEVADVEANTGAPEWPSDGIHHAVVTKVDFGQDPFKYNAGGQPVEVPGFRVTFHYEVEIEDRPTPLVFRGSPCQCVTDSSIFTTQDKGPGARHRINLERLKGSLESLTGMPVVDLAASISAAMAKVEANPPEVMLQVTSRNADGGGKWRSDFIKSVIG